MNTLFSGQREHKAEGFHPGTKFLGEIFAMTIVDRILRINTCLTSGYFVIFKMTLSKMVNLKILLPITLYQFSE